MPRAIVTGGAGFLGSHLCERLVGDGWDVVCLDSLLTGNPQNLSGVLGKATFRFEHYDATNYLHVGGPVDWIMHFASPASPRDYLEHPIHTLKIGALGTLRALGLARAKGAGLLLASTSEVYGDPQVHPQPEDYWGNVNPVGPRGVYDEAKRYAEATAMAYHRVHGVPVKIARIFNTYGPRLRKHDGRAVPTFIHQALADKPVTVHGDGTQTRSLCYVDDMIEGLWLLLQSDVVGCPMNLGNPEEITIGELARTIVEVAGSSSEIVYVDRPEDDPELRRPDITFATRALGWEPKVGLVDGLRRTVEWARENAWADGSPIRLT
ncbi:MAG TPA: UDP-glucuronic acid decarboxylase family protein [Actinomycetota bacterium]|nr:UDP-glucuronic acid decarboxylase family protein [Actinomycetota bacterium]